jgi:hypothetical protein
MGLDIGLCIRRCCKLMLELILRGISRGGLLN